MKDQIYFKSPLGFILISASAKGVNAISFSERRPAVPQLSKNVHLRVAVTELREYFLGERLDFSFPLDIEGTAFQKKVWRALRKINFGITCSYSDIAKMIRSPKAVRAVGGANNKNPIAIVIPCHRVLGKSGSLVGYAAGLRKKWWLLRHEGMAIHQRSKTLIIPRK